MAYKGTPLVVGEISSVYVNKSDDGIKAIQQVANLTQFNEDGEPISGFQAQLGDVLYMVAPFSVLYQLGFMAVNEEGFALIDAETIDALYSSAPVITTNGKQFPNGWAPTGADGRLGYGSIDEITILGSVTREMFDAIFSSTPFEFENDNNDDNNNQGDKNMAEIKLNRPNWLGSEVGMVLKTVTVSSTSGTTVTENGRTILRSGTLINDTTLGYGLLYNDADVTDGAVVKSIMIRGTYINSKLPTLISAANVTTLATQGLYNITYPTTVIAYGEVTD